MMRRLFNLCLIILTMSFPNGDALAGEPKKSPSPQAIQFFESKVRPLLVEHCFKCHGDVKKPKADLRLDSLTAMLTGGDQGPALVPGQPEKSLLIKAITYDDKDLKMPPAQKLSREQIALVTEWVKMGAPWPGMATDHSATPLRKADTQITDQDRAHWSFLPVKRPVPPAVKNARWVANPIDAFILAGLEAKGLAPNPPATRLELVRRIYYDLTGLPPSLADVESFLTDASPQAYEKLVDKLLASPHYGEKWARYWLDLVRYAETSSYERDNVKPNAWRFRDYIIRAFNQDKPYDRLVREQLAGDELASDDPDALIATGYYRLGIWDDEPSDRLQARYDGLDDLVATTGQVFLGLTLDCARCHNHKIDPIPQKDYYRMLAFFQNIKEYTGGGPGDLRPIIPPDKKLAYQEWLKEQEKRRNQAETNITALEKEFLNLYKKDAKETTTDFAALFAKEGPRLLGPERMAEYKKLKKTLASLKANDGTDMALCVIEAGPNPPDTHILLRGNPNVPGDKVEPGFPEVISKKNPEFPKMSGDARTAGRRLVLADWIASKDNPLSARVIVNRVWQNHFGRGIVRSSNDFGFQGTRPTHPELLDWLAAEFMANDWRFKSLHRLILTSNTYRMSSKGNAQALATDPANDHFWRFDMRRLSAEEVRDSILAISGNLNLKMFGPGVYPEIPKEVLAGQSVPGRGWGKSAPEEQARRSIYIHVKRSLLYPILESFDVAETDRSTPIRFTTTQPTQALSMLNGDFLNKQAKLFADRLRRAADKDVNAQVRQALYLATARVPSDTDVRRGVALIQELQTQEGVSLEAALKAFCLVVLNLNEFIYLD